MALGFLDTHRDKIYALTRMVVGFLFLLHGAQKLFGAFGGPPGEMPAPMLYAAGGLELIGGALRQVREIVDDAEIVHACDQGAAEVGEARVGVGWVGAVAGGVAALAPPGEPDGDDARFDPVVELIGSGDGVGAFQEDSEGERGAGLRTRRFASLIVGVPSGASRLAKSPSCDSVWQNRR